MLRRLLLNLLLLASLGFVGAPTSAQLHKDERLGYSILAPKKWTQIPLRSGEQWICAKFDGDKTHTWTDSRTGYSRTHVPSLRVVAFVDKWISGGKRAEGDADKQGKDEEDDASSGAFIFTKIYKDYDEFLKENFSGGYFITKETEEEEGSLMVRKLEMLAEAPGETGNRVILTWIYPTEVGKVAVEFEVLESVYKKYKSYIDKTFSSFNIIPRTEKLVPPNAMKDFVSLYVLSEMTVEQRNLRKREIRDAAWEKFKENALDGWTPMEFGEVRVITRHDKKHAQAVVDSVEAVTKWLEETFPDVGPGEYVRLPIIRICKDWEEERSFRSEGDWDPLTTEIVTHKDSGGATGSEWGYINNVTSQVWFYERDSDLSLAMPAWLRLGIQHVLIPARVKGRNLKFNENWFELGFIDKEEPWDLEKVMTTRLSDIPVVVDNKISRGIIQTVALTRFLVSGAGSKGRYKGFLADYIATVSDVVSELNKKDKAMGTGKSNQAASEQEEDAALKARQSLFKSRETEILKEAYRRVTEKMDENTLKGLINAYAKEFK